MTPDFKYKSKEELLEVFKRGGIKDPVNDQVIVYCQKGIVACGVGVALDLIGNHKYKLYDGSFIEYSELHKEKK